LLPVSKLFGKLPDRNHLYCIQEPSINGYKILNFDQSQDLFHVISKTASTRAKYRIRETSQAIAVGTINQSQVSTEYKLLGEQDNEIGKVSIGDKEIDITIGKEKFVASDIGRAKRFDFRSKKSNSYVLGIDKKILSFKDAYHIIFTEEFLLLTAAMVAVVIDDYFHRGTR
jgi:hypothetical protein